MPLPDLVAVQRDSFKWFLEEGIAETLTDISPIEDFTGSLKLELADPEFEPPKYSEEECKEKDMTFSRPLFVTARFMNAQTGEIKEQTVFMGDFPMMTEKGTFIINGTERIVVSQLVRSPGVYFGITPDKTSPDLDIIDAKVIPGRGAWLEFEVDKKNTAYVRIDRKRKQPVTILLKALGMGDDPEALRTLLLDSKGQPFESIANTLGRDHTETVDDAFLDIYRKLRPGEPPTVESARGLLENLFFNPKRYDLAKVGRHKVNKKLKEEFDALEPVLERIGLERPTDADLTLTRADILATVSYLVKLHAREADHWDDDIDHFGNRRIRSVGELIQNQVRIGLSRMERVVRERMTTQDVEAITPQTLINIRPVVAAIKEFFGSSQLSQFMDQTNPLSGLTHKRRLSALGPGGLSRERAGFEVRDVHPSHYGRMCPIETPEGPNIGLIGSLASYARVNRFGFTETPYRKVVSGQVTDETEYLAADDEDRYVIAQANASVDEQGRFIDSRVLVRSRKGEVEFVTPRPGRLHGRVAEADRLGGHRPHPVPGARRRQPGAHGRQHAEAGRTSRATRGSLHRDGRGAPGGTRLRRPDHGRGRRPGGRGHRRHDHGRIQRRHRSQDLPAGQVPPLQPDDLHQPAAAGRRGAGAEAGRRAGRRPVDRPRRTGPRARTSSWPSCRGRGPTSRTPSSSPSVSCATTC